MARRYRSLSEEIVELDIQLTRLVAGVAPGLVALPGVGTDHGLYAACGRGGQPREVEERSVLRQPLRGLARVEASSGKVVRHRLNRGGNRDANRALHSICVVRMGRDRRTQAYVARRTAEGKSKREIMRCLKRYVAREVYRILVSAAPSSSVIGS